MGTIDLIVVGRFSDSANVSAVSTGSMTMQTITGLTTGRTVLLGCRIGEKDIKSSSKTIASSICLFIILGIISAFVITFLAKDISLLMNAPNEAFYQTMSYIKICGLGGICIMMFNAFGGIFRGIGDSKTPLILMFVSCAVNIIEDLILTGFFNLGSDGAEIATVTAQGISVSVAIIIIKFKGFGFETSKKYLKPAKSETVQILKYGFPIAT